MKLSTRIKKTVAVLSVAATLAVGGTVASETVTAPSAQAYTVAGYDYRFNYLSQTCGAWEIRNLNWWERFWAHPREVYVGNRPSWMCR